MTPEEQAVIEAAVELCFVREASRFGPVGDAIERHNRELDQAVGELHGSCDGRWQAPE